MSELREMYDYLDAANVKARYEELKERGALAEMHLAERDEQGDDPRAADTIKFDWRAIACNQSKTICELEATNNALAAQARTWEDAAKAATQQNAILRGKVDELTARVKELEAIETEAQYLLEHSTARNDFNYFDGTWNIELYIDSETWERFKKLSLQSQALAAPGAKENKTVTDATKEVGK